MVISSVFLRTSGYEMSGGGFAQKTSLEKLFGHFSEEGFHFPSKCAQVRYDKVRFQVKYLHVVA